MAITGKPGHRTIKHVRATADAHARLGHHARELAAAVYGNTARRQPQPPPPQPPAEGAQ